MSIVHAYILVKIANYPLLYWWMNSSDFRSIQLLKEWPWHRKTLILALLTFNSVSYIPYYINFRFNNRPNMSSILACFLCQFVILEACSRLHNDNDTVNLVSHWYQLDCLLVRSVLFCITSTSGLINELNMSSVLAEFLLPIWPNCYKVFSRNNLCYVSQRCVKDCNGSKRIKDSF